MRLLLVGPDHHEGSLPPYLNVLARGLRALGVRVDRLGAGGLPYDKRRQVFWPAERIVQAAHDLVGGRDLARYDLISLHFGNLEIEQLAPLCWADRPRPPVVHHVHSLDWTLFSHHVEAPKLRAAVARGVREADGFVYFGSHARARLRNLVPRDTPSRVCFLPTTIPAGTGAAPAPGTEGPPGAVPRASLCGFASPWKDISGLLAAFRLMTTPLWMLLAGPFWDDPAQVGVDLTGEARRGVRHGPVDVRVSPSYVDAAGRLALVRGSDFAVFPYRPQPTFQGSGAVADYLAQGVPVVATDVANMRELIGDAGIVVPPGDPGALATAMDRLAADPMLRADLALNARRRAPRFTPASHAVACLGFYRRVLGCRALDSEVVAQGQR